MALADLSMVYSKPEWTISFSEAPYNEYMCQSVFVEVAIKMVLQNRRRRGTYSHTLQELSAWLNSDLGTNSAKVLLQRVLNAAQQVIVGVLLVFEGQATVADMVQVLEPFEVGDGDTASIDVQIRNNEDVALLQDLIGLWGSWTVGTLGDDL